VISIASLLIHVFWTATPRACNPNHDSNLKIGFLGSGQVGAV
jgi:hypothetical protein